jgi:hypothetical protein
MEILVRMFVSFISSGNRQMHFRPCVLLCAVLLFGASAGQAGVMDGLVAYWGFDNSASDLTGHGYDLTLQGGLGYTLSGLVGAALDFSSPGDSSYATRLSVDPAFDFGSDDFTIQFWAYYYGDLGREQTAIEQWTGSGGPGWTFTKMDNGQYRLHSDSSRIDTSGLTLQTGTWYQVVGRKASGWGDIFVNDVAVGSGSLSSPVTNNSSTYPLLLGRRNPSGQPGFYMDGRMDEVAIWSRALSDPEIAQLYNNGNGLALSEAPEPSTFWFLTLAIPLAPLKLLRLS